METIHSLELLAVNVELPHVERVFEENARHKYSRMLLIEAIQTMWILENFEWSVVARGGRWSQRVVGGRKRWLVSVASGENHQKRVTP